MLLFFLLGILCTVVVVYRMRYALMIRAFPADTIKRIVSGILQKSEYISTIQSPHTALLHSRECQESLRTLMEVVGGGVDTIDTISGIDTERLRNILFFQEKRIQQYLELRME